MQFIDRTKIQVKAGDGGHGKAAFRREKFVPKGGPFGGDGGKGADIIFVADQNKNTLLDFRYRRKFQGENGANGETKNQYGKNAPPLIIKVPKGTIIKDASTGEVIADIISLEQKEIVARGGRGGRGNKKFSTSRNKAPTFAEFGEIGESKELILELKLLADVGLVGYPSVGKSSIIASVSAAKPEIADYHFTTLTPVLGVVSVSDEKTFVMADIPGLIEGAADGLGLGHDFLRHIERTKLILHVLDAAGIEGRNPLEDYERIRKELAKYSEKLALRQEIIVANKVDLEEAACFLPQLKKMAQEKNIPFFACSAATKQGLRELMYYVADVLDKIEPPAEEKKYTLTVKEEITISITRNDRGDYIVKEPQIEKLVSMTNFNNDEAVRRFQKIWKLRGLDKCLQEKGIKEGDTVHIGHMEFEYHA